MSARTVTAATTFTLLLLTTAPCYAGVCGQPISDGNGPTATDALYVLRSSVGTVLCTLSACDTSADCSLTATDALRVLRKAVGADVKLDCMASCLTTTPCSDAGAAVCSGVCPPGFACSATSAGLTSPDQRVTVCHVIEGGFETRTVDPAELEKHLNHGDSLDACTSTSQLAMHTGDLDLSADTNGLSQSMTDADSVATVPGSTDPALLGASCGCQPLVIPPSSATTTTTLSQGPTTTTSTSTTNTLPPPPSDDQDNDGIPDSEDPCPADTRNRCFGPIAVDTVAGISLRINANASAYDKCAGARVDCAGDVWNPDFGYSSPFTSSACDIVDEDGDCSIRGVDTLFGCTDEATEDLLRCEHFDRAPLPELGYRFNVPNGDYVVNLFFANTYERTRLVGKRVFDIAIEGRLVYQDFDQVAAAGGSRRAVVRSALVTVTDGNGLQIEFGHVIENPAIKAIEIYRSGSL